MAAAEEPLVAKNGYDLFARKVEELESRGKPPTNITPQFWLKVAKNYASFQQFDNAIKFAENALLLDRYFSFNINLYCF